jgi:hypothetical protein
MINGVGFRPREPTPAYNRAYGLVYPGQTLESNSYVAPVIQGIKWLANPRQLIKQQALQLPSLGTFGAAAMPPAIPQVYGAPTLGAAFGAAFGSRGPASGYTLGRLQPINNGTGTGTGSLAGPPSPRAAAAVEKKLSEVRRASGIAVPKAAVAPVELPASLFLSADALSSDLASLTTGSNADFDLRPLLTFRGSDGCAETAKFLMPQQVTVGVVHQAFARFHAAGRGDMIPPAFLVWHQTGSGKTLLMALLILVWRQAGRKVVVVSSKQILTNLKQTLPKERRDFLGLWKTQSPTFQTLSYIEAGNLVKKGTFVTEFGDAVVLMDEVQDIFRPPPAWKDSVQILRDYMASQAASGSSNLFVLFTATPGLSGEQIAAVLGWLQGTPPVDIADERAVVAACRNAVSYYDRSADLAYFPKVVARTDAAAPMSLENYYKWAASLSKDKLTDYDALPEDTRSAYRILSRSTGNAAADSTKAGDYVNRLPTLSAKLVMLMTEIERHPDEKQFVYSGAGKKWGSLLVAETLKKRGWVDATETFAAGNAKGVGKWHAAGRPRFVLVTHDVAKTEADENRNVARRNKIVEGFNLKENADGSLALLMIADGRNNQGIDLKDVRWVHIFEPQVAVGDEIQAEGRAVRFKSHCNLPGEKRTVAVVRYIHDVPGGLEQAGAVAAELRALLQDNKEAETEAKRQLLKAASDLYRAAKLPLPGFIFDLQRELKTGVAAAGDDGTTVTQQQQQQQQQPFRYAMPRAPLKWGQPGLTVVRPFLRRPPNRRPQVGSLPGRNSFLNEGLSAEDYALAQSNIAGGADKARDDGYIYDLFNDVLAVINTPDDVLLGDSGDSGDSSEDPDDATPIQGGITNGFTAAEDASRANYGARYVDNLLGRVQDLTQRRQTIAEQVSEAASIARREPLPAQMPAQMPAQLPLQMPAQLPLQMPAQLPMQLPLQMPAQLPMQLPLQMPAQLPMQLPMQLPLQMPAQSLPAAEPTDSEVRAGVAEARLKLPTNIQVPRESLEGLLEEWGRAIAKVKALQRRKFVLETQLARMGGIDAAVSISESTDRMILREAQQRYEPLRQVLNIVKRQAVDCRVLAQIHAGLPEPVTCAV